MNSVIRILNKECRTTNHGCCSGVWEGLGMEVWCNCLCHQHPDTTYAKKEDKKNHVPYLESDGKYDNNIVLFNTASILEKQNKNNVSVDKSFRGSNQQASLVNGDDRH